MSGASLDLYVAAFLARCRSSADPGWLALSGWGICGLLPSTNDRMVRLLVTDDQAYRALAALLPTAAGGMITILASAARCTEMVSGDRGWHAEPATAMACRSLGNVPAVALPSGMRLRPVRHLDGDPGDGVLLEEAVEVAVLAQSEVDEPSAARVALAAHLRSTPPSVRLFAATDDQGVVRATSGSGTFGAEATLLFVNTHPGWRGRGIGLAMSAAALRDARLRGARRAALDASEAGGTIYRRLGFEPVADINRFSRHR